MAVEIKNILTRLNLDDAPEYLGKTDYVDALNITQDSAANGSDITIANLIGNQLVPYTFPAGTNTTIKAYSNILRNRVYEFVWNSNGNHSILIYDNTTRTRTKLIESKTDSGGIDILEFDENIKINHVDIIPKTADEGDLVFFTDGNSTPKKFNEKHIADGIYGTLLKSFIEVAKAPPLTPITCVYGNDATRLANSLNRFLFMFTYRFQYDDFEKTSFSTYSKIPLPIGFYGSDNNTDPSKNNFITLTLETGAKNVIGIEVGMRNNAGNDWNDFVLIVALNKADLSIPDNSTYNYLFYNDNLYPPFDIEEVTSLHDWVPRLAECQALLNGNVLDYANITEDYDNIPVSGLDVTITSENVTNSPPDTDPPSITYTQTGSSTFNFTVNGSVPTGTVYRIYVFFNGNPGIGQTYGVRLVAEYTSIGGDTVNDVAFALYSDFNSFSSVPIIIGSHATNGWQSTFGTPGNYIQQLQVIAGSPSVGTITTEKTWLWYCNYLFGLVYQDEQNRNMPGVQTFTNPTDSDNDFAVTTPAFSDDSGLPQTPVITSLINHLPVTDSVKFCWVRRQLTYSNILFYETCDFQSDSDYYYFCLANIEQYKTDNSQFIYGTAPITTQSRIKIIDSITANLFDGNGWTQDYQILGQVTRTLTGGSTPADDRFFIKVAIPTSAPSPVYAGSLFVMVYTPATNPTSIADSIYNEWGETYGVYVGYTILYSALTGVFVVGETVTGGTSGATGIITGKDTGKLGISTLTGTFQAAETITGGTSAAHATLTSISSGVTYHKGKDQDQTSFQPAQFIWQEGDVYFHQRNMYPGLVASPPLAFNTVSVMDSNFSDFFDSAVNDNGRPQVINVNAKNKKFVTLNRFSREYELSTNINQTNRFYYNNFTEYSLEFGDILKLDIRNQYMKVGQRLKIGSVPILLQILKSQTGTNNVVVSDTLLNPIQYFDGEVGVGDSPESWISFNFATYFADTLRGGIVRNSLDGNIVISRLYKVNSWATLNLPQRTGNYKGYGCYNQGTNQYILALEATEDSPAQTIIYSEDDNSFKSFISLFPEMMCTLGTLLISYKNGQAWTHDSSVYNNFFGVQYGSSITPVFNENAAIKKTFNAIGYQSNKVWSSPTQGDISTSDINPQTLLRQESAIRDFDYDLEENINVAAFNFDMNSQTDAAVALLEGDYLKGTYIEVKFTLPEASATGLVNLNFPYITWSLSNRNF